MNPSSWCLLVWLGYLALSTWKCFQRARKHTSTLQMIMIFITKMRFMSYPPLTLLILKWLVSLVILPALSTCCNISLLYTSSLNLIWLYLVSVLWLTTMLSWVNWMRYSNSNLNTSLDPSKNLFLCACSSSLMFLSILTSREDQISYSCSKI